MKNKQIWQLLHEDTNEQLSSIEHILTVLLKNRGVTAENEKGAFLHPVIETVTPASVDIAKGQLLKAVKRIMTAIKQKEKIVVYGDYDVDGITGTAILWETLYMLKAHVTPYIPERIEEGYGLSIKGIDNILKKDNDIKIIITIDNGIVAHDAIAYAREKGIAVIVTDHHAADGKDLQAFATVHTTRLCGASVGWLFAREIMLACKKTVDMLSFLDLVALATVADLVKLTNGNRILLSVGLPLLRKTKRVGLHALFQEAGINRNEIGVYEIGHIIAPRLNAMGRMSTAMDSLRLLCTKDAIRAHALSERIGTTNRERQLLTKELSEHAKTYVVKNGTNDKLLIVSDSKYEQGVIGLIAGRLVEEFYKPAIVISLGEVVSKASARSVNGFNIIEHIRTASHLLINAGGHPMAAGFTIETEKIKDLVTFLTKQSNEALTDQVLQRLLKIDCEINFSLIDKNLYAAIQTLSPFGVGNPQPLFITRQVTVKDVRRIGMQQNHLKLTVGKDGVTLGAIAFGMGEVYSSIQINSTVDIAYTIEENKWNGNVSLQLKLKDIAC